MLLNVWLAGRAEAMRRNPPGQFLDQSSCKPAEDVELVDPLVGYKPTKLQAVSAYPGRLAGEAANDRRACDRTLDPSHRAYFTASDVPLREAVLRNRF